MGMGNIVGLTEQSTKVTGWMIKRMVKESSLFKVKFIKDSFKTTKQLKESTLQQMEDKDMKDSLKIKNIKAVANYIKKDYMSMKEALRIT